jgi:5'-3' exonuclease
MKYAIVDMANIFFRSKYAASRIAEPSEKVGMSLHITFNSINSIVSKHKVDHVVIATEGRSWRKDFYKPYKANRAEKAKNMTIAEVEDEKLFNEAYNNLIEYFVNQTALTVLNHPKLEGDDLINGWITHHPNDSHVINSSDSDFFQLLSENVIQYNGISEETHTLNGIFDKDGNRVIDKKTKEAKVIPDPKWLLFEKCIRGDSSDNIFSAYPGVRTKGSKNKVGLTEAYDDMNKKGFAWNNFMLNSWEDHEGNTNTVRDMYERNKTLIDLNAQPAYIKEIINETISNVQPKKISMIGARFLKFCGKHELLNLSKNADNISSWLSKPYKE